MAEAPPRRYHRDAALSRQRAGALPWERAGGTPGMLRARSGPAPEPLPAGSEGRGGDAPPPLPRPRCRAGKARAAQSSTLPACPALPPASTVGAHARCVGPARSSPGLVSSAGPPGTAGTPDMAPPTGTGGRRRDGGARRAAGDGGEGEGLARRGERGEGWGSGTGPGAAGRGRGEPLRAAAVSSAPQVTSVPAGQRTTLSPSRARPAARPLGRGTWSGAGEGFTVTGRAKSFPGDDPPANSQHPASSGARLHSPRRLRERFQRAFPVARRRLTAGPFPQGMSWTARPRGSWPTCCAGT